jgi:hypothetical protein
VNSRRFVLLALALVGAAELGAQRPAQRRCLLQVLNVDREGGFDTPFADNVNYYGGGNVRMRCTNQQVFIQSDSVESIGGIWIRFIGNAQYRDDDVIIEGDTLTYRKSNELLEARVDVRILNKRNGSTLEGPYVDYLRAVRGVRDSAESTALTRPKVTYNVPKSPGDSVAPSPYVIVADGLKGFGSSSLIGWGNVTVDRDSLAGRGDSLLYASGPTDEVTLVGNPATLKRAGADSFSVAGRHVVLALQGEELRRVRALGQGRILGGAGEIIADSAALEFEEGKLVATRAWDRAARARVIAEGYDITGDSVAIDTPNERLRELRVFGNGRLVEPQDSLTAVPVDTTAAAPDSSDAPIRNTMTGNRLIARFVDHDSAGTTLTQLLDITAIGTATSLFSRNVQREGRSTPSINYTRADTIVVVMRTGDSTGVLEVRAFGNVDGMQLEQESLRRRATNVPAILPGRREDVP